MKTLINSYTSFFNNKSGAALLIALFIGFFIASTAMVAFISTKNSAKRVSMRRQVVSAFNIAEAGKEHAIAKIRTGSCMPVAGVAHVMIPGEFFESGSYAVTYDANPSVDTLLIHSLGVLNGSKALIDVVCVFQPVIVNINPTIEAAVTTRSATTVTGNITIDGQDWNADGSAVVADGVYGIKSSGTVSVDGSAQVGGNGNPPTSSPGPTIINLCTSTEVPTTPEEALGLPPGTLDAYKTTVEPSYPVHGIYYYAGTSELKPKFDGSTGIFIAHNDSYTGRLKNIHGEFTGIIIADQIVHINANAKIIGAVITLSTSAGGNAFGNGDADVLYSSAVVQHLINTTSVVTDTTYDVVSWRQVQ